MTTTRHAAHVEEIRPGVLGLHLGESDPEAWGPDGYALMDEQGRIQWTAEDVESAMFRRLPVDPTTGAYILPSEEVTR